MKKILGISTFNHDSEAALTFWGSIIVVAQEESFTREKRIPNFPTNTVRYCLKEAGLEITELDAIGFYNKQLFKFERLLETYYAFALKCSICFIKSIPVWLIEKMFIRK